MIKGIANVRELAALLVEIVGQTSFDLGRTPVEGWTSPVTLGEGPELKFSPDQSRKMLANANWHAGEGLEMGPARLVVPHHVVETLTDKLRELLARYVVAGTDLTRHVLPVAESSPSYQKFEPSGLMKLEHTSTLSAFAKGLIRGAALLGPDRAAELMSRMD